MYQITVDTGGTFTDAVLADAERRLSVSKVPTDSQHPENGIMKCISLLAQERKSTEEHLLAGTETIIVGTTLPTNVLLEGKGAKCGLFYTKGFRDILDLGSTVIGEMDIYDAKVSPPVSLIPRSQRWGIEERTLYTGEILTPLNENDVLTALKKAKAQKIEVPVVCFLHSYANPQNEEKVAALIKTEYPNVVLSSHILRRWIEYDRLSAATLAAYVKPAVTGLVALLSRRLQKSGFKGGLLFITAIGGVTNAGLTADNPALLLNSGPAGGVLMGRFLAELSGYRNVITADMGGTSFDVSVMPDRRITTTTESLIGEWKNAVESMDIMSIGAGGGSIAWIDDAGMLRVGPASATANPGPACYGRGGKLPTVTDANMILGYCPTDSFLGGTLPLYPDLSKKAIEENIARNLKISVVEAAYSIASIVEANMADRIFLSAVQKGYDPRDFTFVIGGGAGPIHGASLAARLKVKEVYIPKYAGMFSALGMIVADYKHVVTRFYGRAGGAADIASLKTVYGSLEEDGAAILKREKINKQSWRFVRGAEMRYQGQLHPIDVLLPETRPGKEFTEKDRKALIAGFHDLHKAIYGWSDASYPVAVETLKLQAVGVRPSFKPLEHPASGRDASGAKKQKRQAYFKERGGYIDTPCYDGNRLSHGNVIKGPAIIDEANTTVVVPPGTELTVDAYGNYIIKL